MKKINLLLLFIGILSFLPMTWAQVNLIEEQESVIDISPAELQLLVEELIQTKRKRLAMIASKQTSTGKNANISDALEAQDLRQQMDEMQKTLNGIERKINQSIAPPTNRALDRQDLVILKNQLLGEIQSLKILFDDLTLKTTPSTLSQAENESNRELMVFATQMMQLRKAVDSLFIQFDRLVEKEEFEQLTQQLDKLEKQLQISITTNPNISEALAEKWEKQFDELHTLLEKGKNDNTTELEYDYTFLKELVEERGKHNFFFKTNAILLDDQAKAKIQESIDLIKIHERLDVLIVGYADEKGDAHYNQKLSQKRAEEVKKYIMNQGIHPSRIFTQSHGVDYSAENQTVARRVDVVLLIKR